GIKRLAADDDGSKEQGGHAYEQEWSELSPLRPHEQCKEPAKKEPPDGEHYPIPDINCDSKKSREVQVDRDDLDGRNQPRCAQSLGERSRRHHQCSDGFPASQGRDPRSQVGVLSSWRSSL